MRIGVLAPVRFPILEPFAGGLEAHTAALARGLAQRGHDVVLFAAPGSTTDLGSSRVEVLEVSPAVLSEAARADVSMSAEWWMQEHHAYLTVMLDVAAGRHGLDVLHNNSLHHLPIAMAGTVGVPVVTTLHTPPTPWIESAVQAPARCAVQFAAVSEHTARAWAHAIPDATVVRNGIDTERWSFGTGGDTAVWTGRLVPEKGAHLAALAAREAGVPLRIAGPVLDRDWFDAELAPLLHGDIEHVGHLNTVELADLVGSSAASLATPCWDEPYGLVVAESLASGTPVAGFARGALPEVVCDRTGRLVGAGDVRALAGALLEAVHLDREDCRARAVQTCSVESMLDGYEQLYSRVRGLRAA